MLYRQSYANNDEWQRRLRLYTLFQIQLRSAASLVDRLLKETGDDLSSPASQTPCRRYPCWTHPGLATPPVPSRGKDKRDLGEARGFALGSSYRT